MKRCLIDSLETNWIKWGMESLEGKLKASSCKLVWGCGLPFMESEKCKILGGNI